MCLIAQRSELQLTVSCHIVKVLSHVRARHLGCTARLLQIRQRTRQVACQQRVARIGQALTRPVQLVGYIRRRRHSVVESLGRAVDLIYIGIGEVLQRVRHVLEAVHRPVQTVLQLPDMIDQPVGGAARVVYRPVHQRIEHICLLTQPSRVVLTLLDDDARLRHADYTADILASLHYAAVGAVRHISRVPADYTADIVPDVLVAYARVVGAAHHDALGISRDAARVRHEIIRIGRRELFDARLDIEAQIVYGK